MSVNHGLSLLFLRTGIAVALALLTLMVPLLARADGEAGIVIQNGDAVTTHCVAFEGESITGEQALRASGHMVEQFGGGSRTLCAIDDVGCFDPSSFNTCFCQCPGGPGCTYWAFFTKPSGQEQWSYSTLAFNTAELRQGDMQAYKWGEGSPNSAPAPVDISFAEVCGGAKSATGSPQQMTPLPAGSPEVTVTLDGNEGSGESNTGTLVAFGAVAGVLAVAAAGAFLWRRNHGA